VCIATHHHLWLLLLLAALGAIEAAAGNSLHRHAAPKRPDARLLLLLLQVQRCHCGCHVCRLL
jgi:hypothetical protein